MNTRELFTKYGRPEFEQWARDRRGVVNLPDALLCRVINRHNLYVDPSNLDMTPWLALDGYWEPWVTLAVGRAIQPGWRCVDVGAWCGYYSILLGDLVGSSGYVLAMEPNPRHAPLCQRSLRANGVIWSYVMEVAASNKNLPQSAFHTADDYGGSRLSETDGDIEVATATLDIVLEGWSRVDFLKVDAEGHEPQIWDGMQETVKRWPHLIMVMEWTPGAYGEGWRDFALDLAEHFIIREVTHEGGTRSLALSEMERGQRILWLQR